MVAAKTEPSYTCWQITGADWSGMEGFEQRVVEMEKRWGSGRVISSSACQIPSLFLGLIYLYGSTQTCFSNITGPVPSWPIVAVETYPRTREVRCPVESYQRLSFISNHGEFCQVICRASQIPQTLLQSGVTPVEANTPSPCRGMILSIMLLLSPLSLKGRRDLSQMGVTTHPPVWVALPDPKGCKTTHHHAGI